MKIQITLALLVGCLAPQWAQAGDDFRVETKVFRGKESSPEAEITTLFHEGKVYDYLSKPNEITVFDPGRNRIVLLNPVRRERAEVRYEEVLEFTEQVKALSAKQSDALLKFAVDPHFDQKQDENGNLTFAAVPMTYVVTAEKASNPRNAQQYREFSDAYARLNFMTKPGAVPPFPRLVVDEVLVKQGLVPQQVQLTIAPRRRLEKADMARSEHRITWFLADSDLKRIDETQQFLVNYTPVSLKKYLHLAEDTAGP